MEPNSTVSGLIQGQTQNKIQIPKKKISTAFQSTKQWVVWCGVESNKKREKKGPLSFKIVVLLLNDKIVALVLLYTTRKLCK